jgi:hypothetical protein
MKEYNEFEETLKYIRSQQEIWKRKLKILKLMKKGRI